MLLLRHLEIEICDYSWRTSLSFTAWRKKQLKSQKVVQFKPWWSDFPHSSQLRPWSFTVIIPLSLRQVSLSKRWQRNRRCLCFIFVFGTCGFNKKVRHPQNHRILSFLLPQNHFAPRTWCRTLSVFDWFPGKQANIQHTHPVASRMATKVHLLFIHRYT